LAWERSTWQEKKEKERIMITSTEFHKKSPEHAETILIII
jgi:hypothetical protein